MEDAPPLRRSDRGPWPGRLREHQVHRLRPWRADPAEFAGSRATGAADYPCSRFVNRACGAGNAMRAEGGRVDQ